MPHPGFAIDPIALPVSVGGVLPNGPAAAAGLHTGDQVVAIDGVSVQGLLPDGVIVLIGNHRPGTVVMLGISRPGVTQTIKIPNGKPPT